ATARCAALCAEQESLLDELLADDLAHCQTQQGTLKIAPMLAMSDARRAAIIRRWLAGQNAPMPSREALVRIWQEVALAREDASPCLRLGAFEIRRYQSQLWWIKSVAGQSETIVPWQTW
ncbi:TilS substrate-binding domain-containing protein, partial [Pseudomonas aeruginosa]|uniref:TilS substrate-binding domain-containing protein n=1 Tax=Pseudomonas aeruginosa TaxID=287 RepID=UPI0031B72B2D